jgi:flavodoxin
MKVLVAYMSETGKTKKVAEAIYEEISAEKEIKELSEVASLEGHDFAFIGFPMHVGGAPDGMRAFLEKHSAGKRMALFVTHAAPENYPRLPDALENCKRAAAGAKVLGLFNCQGEMSVEVANYLLNSGDPEMQAAGRSRSFTIGQPDSTRLERARAFAREVMEKAGCPIESTGALSQSGRTVLGC